MFLALTSACFSFPPFPFPFLFRFVLLDDETWTNVPALLDRLSRYDCRLGIAITSPPRSD